jgi:RimJ/RimL family protein N-acetyltransferase
MKRIYLRDVQHDDLELMRNWRNKCRDNFFNSSEITKEMQEAWYDYYISKYGNEYMYIVICADTNKPCGTIGLYNIDYIGKTAEIGRIVIAEKYQGMGYAKEALQEVERIAFEELGLSKLKLSVYMDNWEAVNLYNDCGFKPVKRPIVTMELKRYDDLAKSYESQESNIK